MGVRAIVLAMLSAMCLTSAASSFNVTERSMAERYHLADVVLVGQALSAPTTISLRGQIRRAVRMRSLYALKGIAGTEFDLLIDSGFAELRVQCCVLGGRYLLFLKQVDGERFGTVNGRFGALRLEPSES
ncbi:MAG: hypothetical protein JNK07_05760 [Alphaproteobacteria bacterium]|nr:hypothetical protein [Alphaproteobacteria bacterium]